MAANKQKPELTWIDKEKHLPLKPHALLQDNTLSYHAKLRISSSDIFDNKLIFGDNLLALAALEQEFSGKIKCVFIDPPYNTGGAFAHYDDGLEHSIWLGLMRDRLVITKQLLADDGSLWITIDDNEAHYLKVVCDEIFGRQNFIGNAIWEKTDSPRMDAAFFSVRHDHLLVYAKDATQTLWKRLPVDNTPDHYNKTDALGRKYYLKPLRAMGGRGDSRTTSPTLYFALIAPDGTNIFPVRQDGTDGAWRWSKAKVEQEIDRIEWSKSRGSWIPYFRIYATENSTRPPETIWQHGEVGSTRTSKAEIKKLFPDSIPFGTPKPERLIQRVLSIATNPNDLVLDFFAGSGTTGAVAHKMGRRWIMVEMGQHCHTCIIARLKKVIDGQDNGGITESVGWQSGGGFRYYHLAPTLIINDRWNSPIIDLVYDAVQLVDTLAKLEGFNYAPSEITWWQHGHSGWRNFIFVTTQNLSFDQLQQLSEEVFIDQSLLVYCLAFYDISVENATKRWPNLTLKKIPKMILDRCKWNHDDYSLSVANLPTAKPNLVASATTLDTVKKSKSSTISARQGNLFGAGE
jgi:adenine-specific DNA-methyltransferase